MKMNGFFYSLRVGLFELKTTHLRAQRRKIRNLPKFSTISQFFWQLLEVLLHLLNNSYRSINSNILKTETDSFKAEHLKGKYNFLLIHEKTGNEKFQKS